MSPMARSLELLRELGYYPEIVERTTGRIKRDLWGWADILALRMSPEFRIIDLASEILAVQTTTLSNMSARINKIKDSDTIGMVRACGINIHVHGWAKRKGIWVCKTVDLS